MTNECPLAWHVIVRLSDGRFLATRTAQRRWISRLVHRHGRGRGLLAYCLAGDHLHVLVVCDRAEAGKFAHAVEVAARIVLAIPVSFEAARIRPIVDQRHLESACRYILRQEKRHGLRLDLTLDANSVADLWGLRALGADLARLHRELLPRVVIGRDEVGFSRVDIAAAPMHLASLADAAAGALGLATIRGKGSDRLAARTAAVQVGLAAGLSPAAIASALGMHASGVRRVRNVEVDPAVARAVELQLRLRGLLEQRRGACADAAALEGVA